MRPILTVLCVLLGNICFSQSGCPPNLDFEQGDFTNWQCFKGITQQVNSQNTMQLDPSPPDPNRHKIWYKSQNPGVDPYGKFPRVCPYGSNYSVQLGNDSIGSQAESVSYTFTVPTTIDTFTFTYFYAVVLEDPNHFSYEQPRFFVTAYEVNTGQVINCASYNYVSNGSMPGFQKSTMGGGDVLYKEWTPASLQFAGMGGHVVRLEFKTADCTRGGHFGYAYLDVAEACSNILATAPYCVETNSLVLNAPYGFKNYTWYNSTFTAVIGTGQSITLSPPPATTGLFYVDIDPYPGFGCRDTLQAFVQPLPVPDTPSATTLYKYCQYQTSSRLTATGSGPNEILWYTTPTGGTPLPVAPTPPTNVAGTFYYYVSQKVLFGCESFRRKVTVIVVPIPTVNFSINQARQCQDNNNFIFTSTTTRKLNSEYAWNFGDNSGSASTTDSVVSHTYTGYGVINVTLKVTNDSACSAQRTLPITLVPKPVATFSYPAVICQQQTPVTLIDNSRVPNNLSTINTWWWNINNAISSVKNPTPYVSNTAGSMSIKLVVATPEGCVSDTHRTDLFVRSQPKANFRYSMPLCENQDVTFSNLSAIPGSPSGETIDKWYWDFGSAGKNYNQNPVISMLQGNNTAQLIAETNFGCKSTPKDTTLTIHPKPLVRIFVSDSCALRNIKFTATDQLNIATSWYWNFGNGSYKGSSVVTKTYYNEGNLDIILVGETQYKCRDTIHRPLTIFDNKSFAGNDTIAAKNEPVQLNAHGGSNVKYQWTPSLGLNSDTLEAPIARLNKDQLYKLYSITDKGCTYNGDVLIRRYAGPELYIPTAFTPNGDGKNDVLKVFPVGMKTFQVFAIYNRYGQLLFKTTDHMRGWDGTFNGKQVEPGTYVAYSTAIDYKGQPVMKKITVVLIR